MIRNKFVYIFKENFSVKNDFDSFKNNFRNFSISNLVNNDAVQRLKSDENLPQKC